jgi:hypothetical protein
LLVVPLLGTDGVGGAGGALVGVAVLLVVPLLGTGVSGVSGVLVGVEVEGTPELEPAPGIGD